MQVDKEQLAGSDDFYLLKSWNAEELARLPARTLAYIGDAVYELSLRLHHVRSGIDDAGRLHDSLVNRVSSTAQARIFDQIYDEVSEDEQQMLKTWRNARISARHGSGTRGEYARATALEAWVAWLFLTDQKQRLQELFGLVTDADSKEQNSEHRS